MQIRIAENIRNLRKEHSMTQEQLADALGVTVGAVYKWEAGLSLPEVRLIMEMADLFDISVDSLLGYVQMSGSVQGRIDLIRDYLAKKDFLSAAAEAEKALKKYPNNFRLVYTCAFMYMVKTTEDKSLESMNKSNDLFEKALSLLDRQTSGDISEATIMNYIATNYLSVGDIVKALDILKQNNVRHVNSSLISFLYAVELQRPDEAISYAQKNMIEMIVSMIRTAYGISFAYALKGDRACISSLKWLTGFVDSLKTDPGTVVYTDKFKAVSLALLAVWEEMFGYSKDAQEHLNEAFELAKSFDSDPVYSSRGIMFISDADGKMIDSFGKTVCEAVETYVFDKVPENNASAKIRRKWEEMNGKGRA